MTGIHYFQKNMKAARVPAAANKYRFIKSILKYAHSAKKSSAPRSGNSSRDRESRNARTTASSDFSHDGFYQTFRKRETTFKLLFPAKEAAPAVDERGIYIHCQVGAASNDSRPQHTEPNNEIRLVVDNLHNLRL